MIRVNRWIATALTAAFLLIALLVAGTRVLQADAPSNEAASGGAAFGSGTSQSPYRIEPLDLLAIHTIGTLIIDPIDGTYLVEPNGLVDLGASYGRADINGLTLEEAEARIAQHLKKILMRPEVQVTAAGRASQWQQVLPPEPRRPIIPGDLLFVSAVGTLLDAPVQGLYRVEPAGTIALGPVYGRARVQGLTQEAAAKAIEKKLKEVLRRVDVEVITEQARQATPPKTPYAIGSGDVLFLNVVFERRPNASFHGVYPVEPAGTVLLGPAYGRIEVKGLSLEAAEQAIREHVKKVRSGWKSDLQKPAGQPNVLVTLAGWKIAESVK
jgi:protein involved in polysaccharide export with SLBB domain